MDEEIPELSISSEDDLPKKEQRKETRPQDEAPAGDAAKEGTRSKEAEVEAAADGEAPGAAQRRASAQGDGAARGGGGAEAAALPEPQLDGAQEEARAVVVIKAEEAEEEAPDEDRSPYAWEGPCSSGSDSAAKSEKKEKKKIRPTTLESSSESSEEEEEEAEEEEERFPREEYIEVYKIMSREKYVLARKNLLLQRKLFEYCRKKNLEVYFQEIGPPDAKLESKYFKQLNAFDSFIQHDSTRRKAIAEELQKLEKDKMEAERLFASNLEELLTAEREVGTGLISGTSGKILPDKTLDKLLSRQRKTILQLSAIRLTFIRLRDAVAAKEAALKKLETFGDGLHLVDYEQLRMENQSYSDKIEERDEELTRLRTKATSSIQILAHIREKANATSTNIEDLYENLESIDFEANQAREYIGFLKKKREELRIEHSKLRSEAGLLVHRRLIKDFERSIEESQALTAEIENLKNSYCAQSQMLTHIAKTTKARRSISLSKYLERDTRDERDADDSRKSSSDSADSATVNLRRVDRKRLSHSTGNIQHSRPTFFPQGNISRILKY